MSSRVMGCVGLAACVLGLGVSSLGSPAAHATTMPTPPVLTVAPSNWLGLVNVYRAASGLPALTDEPSWDQGILNHLQYMALTPGAMSGYAHSEDPSSPYYTASGALEASRSDLWLGLTLTSANEAIDGWLTAPFHAEAMLRPGLQQIAFAMSTKYPGAGLDVLGGLDYSNNNAFYTSSSSPILFPGPGMSTNLSSFGGESPSPLQTCGWDTLTEPVGLPLFAILPGAVPPGASASLTLPTGEVESSAAGSVCVVDQYTYTSTDPLYGPTGADILSGDHLVIVIPRQPLLAGTNSVDLALPGQPDVRWSFNELSPIVVANASGATLTAPTGGVVRSLNVKVSESGQPLAGVPVQFSIAGSVASFTGGASSVTVVTDSSGIASTPSVVAGPSPGYVQVTESVASDPSSWTTSLTIYNAAPELSTSITGPRQSRAGALVTERVIITNVSASVARWIHVSLQLPSRQWQPVSRGGAATTASGLSWQIPALAAGASSVTTLRLRAPRSRSVGLFRLDAQASGSALDHAGSVQVVRFVVR